VSAGRVFVLGNAGLDLRIELPRLPRPGETMPGANPSRAPGGKGLNQAIAAARAGATVHFLAPLGADATGAEIADALGTEGLAALVLPRMPAPTDYSLVMVLPDGENSITGAGPCAALLPPEAADAFLADARGGDIVLLQGNLSAATTEAALRLARRNGARGMVNTAPLWWDMRTVLAQCDLVVANRGEAARLSGSPDPVHAAAMLAEACGEAVVTLGAEGCMLAGAAEGVRAIPTDPVAARDTTGCGDAFCGVLAARLAAGLPIETAIGDAQRAAALTATRAGAFAALPTRAELAA
jgi:ribokinase